MSLAHAVLLPPERAIPLLPALLSDLIDLVKALELQVTVQPAVASNAEVVAAIESLGAQLGGLLAQQPQAAVHGPGELGRWDELIDEMRKIAKLSGSRQQIAAVGMGMREDYPLSDAQHATLQSIARGVTDYETRLDYAGRTDDQPVYLGRNGNGIATNVETWVIEKLTYDVDDRPTRKQVLTGAWDDRTSLPW